MNLRGQKKRSGRALPLAAALVLALSLPGCGWPAAIMALMMPGGSGDGALLLFPPGSGAPTAEAPAGLTFATNASYNEGQAVSLSPVLDAGSQPITYTIAAGALPAGLTLDSATGAITGTIQVGAAVASPYSFTVRATNEAGSVDTALGFVVTDPSVKAVSFSYNQSGNTTGPFRAGAVTITATLEVAPTGTPQIAIDQQGTNDIAATNMTGAGTVWTYTYTVNTADATNSDGTAVVTFFGTPSVGVSYGAATNASFDIDTAPPTILIGAPSATLARFVDTITYAITYGGAASVNLTVANVTLNTTGTAACNVAVLNGTTLTPTVQLSSCVGDGTVTITIDAARASDAAGNTDPGAGPSAAFTVDNVPPSVAIGAPSAGVANSSATVSYGVTYTGAAAVNLLAGNISLNTTGTATCSVGVLNGTTATPTVQLSSCTGDGTVSISVVSGRSNDSAGNVDAGAGPSATFTVDNTAPSIGISGPSAAQGKNGDTITFGVTYTGASTINLLNGNISLNTTGTATCSVNIINGATTTPTVQLTSCSGDGTVGINVASGRATDAAGNADPGAGPSATFTVDNTAPTIGIGAPSATDAKNGDTVTLGVTYGGASSINLLNANISLNTTGTATCSVNVLNGTTATPTVQLTSCTGDGTVGISVAAGRASDAAGNTDPGAGPSTTFNVDNTAPTAGISAPSATDAKSGDTVSYTVTYTGGTVFSLLTANITVNTTGTAACSGVNVVNGTTATPTVQLSGCTGDGTASITVAAGRATDAVGNADAGAGPSATFTVDNTAPTIGLGAPSATQAKNGDTVTVGVTYGGATSINLLNANIALNTTGTATCSINVLNGTTATPTVQLSTCTGDGTVGITVAGARASDAAGNTDPGAGPSATFTVDNTAPTAMISVPSSGDAKNGDTVTYTVTYSGAATVNLLNANISLNTTGTATCGTVNVVNGTTATPTVQLSGCTGDGTVGISVAAGRSSDAAANTDAGAGPSTTFNVDNAPPSVGISTPSSSYAKNGDTVAYTVTYTGASTVNLLQGNITLTPTGTAACSTVNVVNGTTATPDVQVSGCTGNGTINITVAAGVALDAAGNSDGGAGPSTIFNVDNTTPVISAVSPASSASVNNTLVSYTFSEICASATITWTRTGGSADGSSPHVQSLTGSELNAGVHNNVTLTNNPTLVDSAIYDIAFNCTDRVALVATTVTSTGVTFTDAPLAISGAETMDTNSNGKIDTYKIVFNKPVNDSTFPGYSLNSLGSVTTQWLIAGYTNVRLIHGTATAAFATDTPNDAVIYVRFDETLTACNAANQAGCDTGAKPDVTTTATPGLQDLATNALAQVGTAAVTEADRASPILVTAKSLGATSLDAIFSEAMDQGTAENDSYYVLTGGLTVSSATRDAGNNKIVHLVTSTQTGGSGYTLTVNTDVKDLANLNLSALANSAAFTGLVKPVVSSIVATNATTLTITFNEPVTAASTECIDLTSCALIYANVSLPVKGAVSTAGAGNNSASFTLTVNDMVEGQLYSTSVLENTVTSVASGEKMGNVNNSATFTGDGRPAPYVHGSTQTQCGLNGARRVLVQYDQAVGASALTLTNYRITQCESGACATGTGAPNLNGAATVTDMGMSQYAVDFTDAFNTSGDQYRLNVSGVLDSTGNAVATPTNLVFQCGTDTTGPVLISADVVSSDNGSTQVMLTFSEAVDSVTANTQTNYKFDSNAFGFNVTTASIQGNPTQVLVTFAPGLANGGHQITVQNVRDLATNPIVSNGTNNVQPIIVSAPTGFSGGSVFTDPFGDGTAAGTIVIYDGKLYLGADAAASKLFEADYGLTTSRTIILDADGTLGAPIRTFLGHTSTYSGTVQGVDTLYAACVGGTSTPSMTSTACTGAGGTERLFIGALNITGNYISYWDTADKSSSTTTFTFGEGQNPDPGGGFAYRSTVFVVFKDFLWNHFGAEAGGGGRGGRICVNPSGCAAGSLSYGQGVRQRPYNFARVGNQAGAGALLNGSRTGVTGSNYLNAINVLYEHDNDGVGGNESQLYMANGGVYTGPLGAARATNSDGGILRTRLAYSTKSSLPPDCSAWVGACDTYWEDLTPDANTRWNNFVSIPLPQNSAVSGASNCASGGIEFDCLLPYNVFVPAMKAIPYMRTAPNGDLYVLRNACSSQQVCVNGAADITGFGGCEFRTTRQVCPPGSEVPQVWMLPKNCGTAAQCAAAWVMVAEYGSTVLSGTATITTASGSVTGSGTAFTTELAVGNLVSINGQTRRVSAIASATSMTLVGNGNADLSGQTLTRSSGRTNMQGNNAIGANNTHATLLEFVDGRMYVGFDNATNGSNVWRADMSAVPSGSTPSEGSFSMVNIPGLDGSASNQRIFSHITVTDLGLGWLILTTRDGSNAMQLYRTAFGQN